KAVMAMTGEARVSNATAMVKSKQRRIGESTQGLACDDGSRIFDTRWMCCVLPERTMTSALSSKNGGTEGAADIRMFPTKDKIYHPVICIDRHLLTHQYLLHGDAKQFPIGWTPQEVLS